jgi:hypothetical protein
LHATGAKKVKFDPYRLVGHGAEMPQAVWPCNDPPGMAA